MHSPESKYGDWNECLEWHGTIPNIPFIPPIPVQTLGQGTFKKAMVEDMSGEQDRMF